MTSEPRLGDLADIESGYAFKSSDWMAQGNPVVKIKNVKDGYVTLEDCGFVSDEIAAKASKFIARGGDVLVSLTGYVGQVGRVEKGDTVLVNQRVGLVRPADESERSFVYHLLRNLRTEIEELATGTAQANVAPRDIMNLNIENLGQGARRKIGEVLDFFDFKIGVNTRISKTLEDLTQTIFKSWFIDFDPVKTKIAGEKPVGVDSATAALFPDSMEDLESGPIPSGWKLQSLSEIGEFRNGLAMQKFPVVDDGSVLPVIKIAQLRAGSTAGADLASGLIDPKFVISDGDILFSWSGTLEIEHWAGGPGALNQHLFKVLGKTVPDWFIFCSSRSHLPEFRKIASGKATTMGHIQRAHLDEAKVAVPPAALLEAVGGFISALAAKKVALLVENRTLTEIRDALLPRLISGELKIPEEMLVS